MMQKVFGRMLHSRKKRCRHYSVIIVLSIMLTAVVSLFISGVFSQEKEKIYAVQASDVKNDTKTSGEFSGSNLQAGLMGIMSSVNHMEEYGIAASSVNITNENEKVLVGTARVCRKEMNRLSIQKKTKQISGIGYFAQRTVRNHHMPSEDYYSLLQIVEAEATGGDLRSKTLIANVVLNRVANEHFPDSIYEVIWDKTGGVAQFSPTQDGRIYTVEISEDTYEAVENALNGEDYSEGALFFMARSSAEDKNRKWFDCTLQRLFEYGGHEFYTFSK